MHVPDGFLDVPTSVATGAIAVGAVGLCLRRAERELTDTGPALAGLTAALVFGAQLVNFPVGPGTSGHLLGGALTAALVGPWTAVVVMTAVVTVQALVFADGGLTALGTNVLLMAVVGVLVAHLVTTAVLRLTRAGRATGGEGRAAAGDHPSGGCRAADGDGGGGRGTRAPARRRVVLAVCIGAAVSVPASAAAFVALFLVGGNVEVPTAALATGMLGWHAVIGVGEAAITGTLLASVLAVRPDLVAAGRQVSAAHGVALASRRADLVPPVADGRSADAAPPRRPWLVAGLVTSVVAGLASLVASAQPDGLEHVAAAVGLDTAARTSAVAASPLAEYALAGIGSPALATALAGAVGVLLVGGTTALVARSRARSRSGTVARGAGG